MAQRTIADLRHPADSQVHVVVKYNPESSEYTCKLFTGAGHYSPADYYTDCKNDALETAARMVVMAGKS